MAVVEPEFEARYLTDISVVFATAAEAQAGGGTQFRDAVQSFQFVPSTSVSSTKGGSPKSVWTASGTATWTLNVKFLQDIETDASLSNFLLEHAGETMQVRFTPNKGAYVQGDVILAVPPIGGDIDAWLDGTLTMGVRGAPEVVPSPIS